MRRLALVLPALALLGGCGDVQALTPAPGRNLPVKPETAPAAPPVDQLIKPTTAERPGRSDELLTRSQTRPDDRFDLPPR